jgi:hypothetical protein
VRNGGGGDNTNSLLKKQAVERQKQPITIAGPYTLKITSALAVANRAKAVRL